MPTKVFWLRVLPPVLLLLLWAGCGPQTVELPVEDLQATAEEIIAQTASVLPTIQPLDTLAPTETRRATATISPTPSITLTPTDTPTPTQLPQAVLTGDVNCRSGPSSHYDFVILLRAGQSVSIVGRSRDSTYWVVQNPSSTGVCWLWAAYTTSSIPIGSVRAVNTPPTKTPTRTPSRTPEPSTSLRLERVITCAGQPSIVIRVFNTYYQNIASWRAQVFNLPSNTLQTTVSSRQFSNAPDECQQTINTLAYRRTGYAILPFDPELADNFSIIFEACTADPERICAAGGLKFDITFLTATPTYTATATSTPTSTATSTSTPKP